VDFYRPYQPIVLNQNWSKDINIKKLESGSYKPIHFYLCLLKKLYNSHGQVSYEVVSQEQVDLIPFAFQDA
jgi:hypothetical protein